MSQVLTPRVKSAVEFRKIPMQVLPADVMKTAHQRSGEQGPSVFHPIGRNAVLHEPYAMIDNPMPPAHAAQFRVGPKLIGVQFYVGYIEPIPSRFKDPLL